MVTEGEGYGTTLLPLDDALRERTDEDGYADSNAAFTGVSCADYTGRFTTDDVRRHLPEFRRASAVVGNWMAWSLLHCSTAPAGPWPATPPPSM
ncbi:hypothetical protein [Streptomyces sp. NPDC007346]|uniref:hypothetical protein n=1 Tax=Streptomyces sp. NPDC007346 TaxID=3154682 RepID=UPI0034536E12